MGENREISSSRNSAQGRSFDNRNGVSRENDRAVSRESAGNSRNINTMSARGNNNVAGYRGNMNGAAAKPGNGAKPGAGRSLSTGNFNGRSSHDGVPGRYATPYHPNDPMPPSMRPMHPAPYFHNPYNHGLVHMHLCMWDPIPFTPLYWPGFWSYCNNYWYDYHVTNTVVVTNYVRDNYNVNLVSYCVSGSIMYAIIDDIDGNTYLKVFDNDDNLLAEQRINRRYCKVELDRENGGCWVFKKNDRDPMLFLYADGQLLIYEADD
jgi:hypothetical protein